jgi:hypothetical protein
MRLCPLWNSSRRRRRRHGHAAALALSLSVILFGRSTLDAQVGKTRDVVCHSELRQTISEIPDPILPNRDRLELYEAWMDFRFNRPADALTKIDRAAGVVRGVWGLRLPPDIRKDLGARLAAYRACIAAHQPPALATITLQAFFYNPEAANERVPAGAGITITADGVLLGQTGADSTLTAKVPSGPIRAVATIAPAWGEAFIDLAPGDATKTLIILDPDKEVGETSDLILAEAVDDIIPATTRSFTFKFIRDGEPVPISRIYYVEITFPDGGTEDLTERFTPGRDGIVAKDPSALFASIARHLTETITLRVEAEDTAGGSHHGTVGFRVGQSRLSLILAPPPSNPTLPVSNVAVAVSVVGGGVAIEGRSDARGRVTFESVPHGVIALDCATTVDGRHYYGQATVQHSHPQSITLMLRHSRDVENQVAAASSSTPAASPPEAGPSSAATLRDWRAAKDAEATKLIAGYTPLSRTNTHTRTTIRATTGPAGVTVERAATLIVPRGTVRVYLSYEVVTTEDERAVDPQWRFDDVWSVAVMAGESAERLLYVQRNVLSQAHVHPVWQQKPGYISSDLMLEEIDVSALARDADLRLTLVGTTVNTRDGLVPTMLYAALASVWPTSVGR